MRSRSHDLMITIFMLSFSCLDDIHAPMLSLCHTLVIS
jgi:hypothetical protein